jgi:serine/threonine-protein kinase
MVNKDSEIARSELMSAGFTVLLLETYDDDVAKGLVVKTEPEAGTEYPEGKEVRIYVSRGPMETQVQVPDLTGLTQAKAIALLKENKLTYEIEEIKQDGDKGKVVEQSIPAGDYVDRETSVTIYISTGEADPVNLTMNIPMPNGIYGSYTIDIYRNGSIAYTKTILGETVAGGSVNIDISGKKTETLIVFIKCNDNDQPNNIQYAKYDIDYDKETVTLNGELGTEKLLAITPATTTPTTEAPTPTEQIPETTQPAETTAQSDQQY